MTTPIYPSDLLDLSLWYLTLPTGKPEATIIYNLSKYQDSPYFQLNNTHDAVLFRAPVEGSVTSGTHYPRSELREMSGPKESDKASWSTSSGTHIMTAVEAVQHLPVTKPSTVIAQIHDDSDDVIEVRLTGKLLEVIHDSKHYGTLDSNYTLGTKFTLQIKASGGVIEVYYNDLTHPKVKITKSASGCYFKIGCYTQSNLSKGDVAGAYAENWVYSVKVTHTK